MPLRPAKRWSLAMASLAMVGCPCAAESLCNGYWKGKGSHQRWCQGPPWAWLGQGRRIFFWYIYIYIYTYIFIFIFIYIYIYIYIYLYLYIFIYIFIYVYLCLYLYIHLEFLSGMIFEHNCSLFSSRCSWLPTPLTIHSSYGPPTTKSPAALGCAGGRGDAQQLHGFLASLGTQMAPWGGCIRDFKNMRKETRDIQIIKIL